ncbi:hypothetical protein ACVWZM_005243 [Bradyrhizobium sp. USDA 4501]
MFAANTSNGSGSSNITITGGSSGAASVSFDKVSPTTTSASGNLRYDLLLNNVMAFYVNTLEKMRIVRSGNVGINTVTPTTALEVNGTISATNLVVNGVSITGAGSTADRIVSGSINAVADVSSGAVRIPGTLAQTNTGNEPCDAAHWYTLRIDPTTQRLQMCRP